MILELSLCHRSEIAATEFSDRKINTLIEQSLLIKQLHDHEAVHNMSHMWFDNGKIMN